MFRSCSFCSRQTCIATEEISLAKKSFKLIIIDFNRRFPNCCCRCCRRASSSTVSRRIESVPGTPCRNNEHDSPYHPSIPSNDNHPAPYARHDVRNLINLDAQEMVAIPFWRNTKFASKRRHRNESCKLWGPTCRPTVCRSSPSNNIQERQRREWKIPNPILPYPTTTTILDPSSRYILYPTYNPRV